MVCSFYRVFLPCTITIVFSAYVSTDDNNDIKEYSSYPMLYCIAHLIKLAISIFRGKIEGNF